ncbi:hypothetical protein EHI8A_078620 [Entamoeba histolytica HM-1:IMSS-B]|uniref:Ral GTPase-activating protein subunit alpha/beta N-terminal domain-containing protein n=5 Tax=Entamoeba histolytica TaxID=5759 RepID=C4M216_ENTH1|nr:hypothetical protein EHI_150130 [Entamoeba histolytica HM-1:IMSS]EMD43048.1 Hypothetical protein EHI5A_073680 [Entamoeba histolytica KU27]EMH74343.1 hypothetical protein EHI8A_078620 [Entamoeba histolytica HM-1:IMSS-B]ENY60970.1 hypothetical protein EHI7A_077100 [Entamoeba histolytica HM-1:IMSS-A]GAT95294.1 hypothetical protein CL6EHI_150130 [Entamoeba histolytica]EAL50409.1 hypothetical protein EHI_150130 [Entamoeba histolytica HM-1:IMSS]|eukprot:XP_655797.1 hypothetical protein EHI_150130 [Entamoeba histolytica HM-1:IMSS]
MFTKTATSLNLLHPENDTDVLNTFDKTIQSGFVSLLCKQLFESNLEIKTHCQSPCHCSWIMEVIGAGFKMDLTNHNLMNQCIDLYELWFIKNEQVPQAILDNYNFYIEKIILQLTFVFAHNPSSQEQKSYEVLCKRVISIYQNLYKLIRSSPIENTFVRMMVAVMDDVFNSQNYTVITELIRFFNQIWICYQPTEIELWKVLTNCYGKWIINQSVVSSWKDVMVTLENHLIKILTKENNESFDITLTYSSFGIKCSMTPKYLLLFYMKFMHLIGNICNIQKTDVHYNLIQAIGNLIDILIGTSLTGNDIYRIFSDILYQTIIYKDHRLFSKSINLALMLLVKIYISKYSITQFDKMFYYKLYCSLSKCLTSSNIIVITNAVSETYKIVESIPSTSSIIFNDIIYAITKISKEPKGTTEEIRPISIKLLQKIQLMFTEQRDQMISSLSKISSEQPFITSVLNICFEFLKIDPIKTKEVFIIIGRVIISLINNKRNKGINTDIILSNFIPLLSSNYHEWFSSISSGNLDSLLELFRIILMYRYSFYKESVKDIFLLIQQYISYKIDNLQSVYPLLNIYSCYFTYCYSIMKPAELLFTINLIDKMNKIIENDNVLSSLRYDIQLYNSLINTYLPSTENNQDVNELILKKELINKSFDWENSIHCYYVFEQAIFSLIELPWIENTLLCIIRTRYGKQIFTMKMHDEEIQWTRIDYSCPSIEGSYKEIEVTKSSWTEKTDFININELMNIVKKQEETNSKTMKNSILHDPIIISKKNWKSYKCTVFNEFFLQRLLSTLLNFNHLTNSPVEELVVSDDLFNELKQLDEISPISQYEVLIKSDHITDQYISFIDNLGELQLIQNEKEKKNLLIKEDNGFKVNYQVDLLNNIIPNTNYKAIIIWGLPDKLSHYDAELQFIISPTTSELFNVQLNQKTGIALESQLIPFETLPSFISSVLLSHSSNSEIPKTIFEERKNILLSIAAFLDTKYTCVATHSLFSKSYLQSTNPVDFKNNGVFEVLTSVKKPVTKSPCFFNRTKSPKIFSSKTTSPGLTHVTGAHDNIQPNKKVTESEGPSPASVPNKTNSPSTRVTLGTFRRKPVAESLNERPHSMNLQEVLSTSKKIEEPTSTPQVNQTPSHTSNSQISTQPATARFGVSLNFNDIKAFNRCAIDEESKDVTPPKVASQSINSSSQSIILNTKSSPTQQTGKVSLWGQKPVSSNPQNVLSQSSGSEPTQSHTPVTRRTFADHNSSFKRRSSFIPRTPVVASQELEPVTQNESPGPLHNSVSHGSLHSPTNSVVQGIPQPSSSTPQRRAFFARRNPRQSLDNQ